jgi:aspartyl-tRNA(Asn)/glutamyl-tRNA(Gln) amidotransferase subunit B
MEEGSLRADANVSVNLSGKGLGSKVEIKNLNSSRFVRLALKHEIERQTALLENGKTVVQETRLWNENRDQTEPMRTKENAQDYRYFPEPDLPVFSPDAAFLASVDKALVELPLPRAGRLTEEYGLSAEQADLVCEEKQLADYFEEAVAAALSSSALPKKEAASCIINWLLQHIKRIMGRNGTAARDIAALALTPVRLAALAVMAGKGDVSGKNARETLEAVIREDRDPADIIREKGWERISDPAKIAEAVKAVRAAEEAAFAEAKIAGASGNVKRRRTLAAYLVGKVLAATGGRADPVIAEGQVEALIEES